MKPKLLLRITAGLVLFFAVGHSAGHFMRKSNLTPEAQEVLKGMESVKFDFNGSMRSFDLFYEGMSLNLIITLLAFTVIYWMLSNGVEYAPRLVKSILWPLALTMAAFTITGFMFFFIVPAVTCLAAAALTAIAIFRIPDTL
jgi:hypothetical protein